jgi:hypothetical protein
MTITLTPATPGNAGLTATGTYPLPPFVQRMTMTVSEADQLASVKGTTSAHLLPTNPVWLRQARLARGWGYRKFARRIYDAGTATGFATATVTSLTRMAIAWERGDRKLSRDYLVLLCRIFGLPAPPPIDRAALAAECGEHQWLKREMILRDWTVTQLIARMRAIAAKDNVVLPRHPSLSRMVFSWRSGQREPDPLYAEILLRIFNLPRPARSLYPCDLRLLQNVRWCK